MSDITVPAVAAAVSTGLGLVFNVRVDLIAWGLAGGFVRLANDSASYSKIRLICMLVTAGIVTGALGQILVHFATKWAGIPDQLAIAPIGFLIGIGAQKIIPAATKAGAEVMSAFVETLRAIITRKGQ